MDAAARAAAPPAVAYSDRVNHAIAYAAVHHAGEMRKGTRVPYITHPAHLAILLARYGCDDHTLVVALLHDVVEDCAQPGHTPESHAAQIAAKFGNEVLRDVLVLTKPARGPDGRRLTSAENKVRYLEELARASERARWVCAADKLHNARALLGDLRRAAHPDEVWSRFNVSRRETVRWYRDVYQRLCALGFDAPIMGELRLAVEELERVGGR